MCVVFWPTITCQPFASSPPMRGLCRPRSGVDTGRCDTPRSASVEPPPIRPRLRPTLPSTSRGLQTRSDGRASSCDQTPDPGQPLGTAPPYGRSCDCTPRRGCSSTERQGRPHSRFQSSSSGNRRGLLPARNTRSWRQRRPGRTRRSAQAGRETAVRLGPYCRLSTRSEPPMCPVPCPRM